jgi:hypothetical protein
MVVKEVALLVKVGALLQILVEGEGPMHHQEEEEEEVATGLMLNIRELQLETKAGQPQEDV